MSIIQKALSKTDREKLVGNVFKTLPVAGKKFPAPVSRPKKLGLPRHFPQFAFVLILVIVLGGALSVANSRIVGNPVVSGPEIQIPDPVVVPQPVKKRPRVQFNLTGITSDPNGAFAIINDHLVGVGDTVGQAVVKNIQGKEVTLQVGRKEISLNL